MSLKTELILFHKVYSALGKEMSLLLRKIKPNDIKGAVRLSLLVAKKEFYPKHDALTLLLLADQHGIKTTVLKQLLKRYFFIEDKLQRFKLKFECASFCVNTLGPKGISGFLTNEQDINYQVSFSKQGRLKFSVFPGYDHKYFKHSSNRDKNFKLFCNSKEKELRVLSNSAF